GWWPRGAGGEGLPETKTVCPPEREASAFWVIEIEKERSTPSMRSDLRISTAFLVGAGVLVGAGAARGAGTLFPRPSGATLGPGVTRPTGASFGPGVTRPTGATFG